MRLYQSLLAAVILAAIAMSADAQCGNGNCTMCYPRSYRLPAIRYTQPIRVAPVARVPEIKSTPQAIVNVMLAELHLIPGDVLYDLGCGDGRVLIAAVEQYGCRGIGIEIDPVVADFARANIRKAGCRGILIQTGDARKFKLDRATAVTMYLDTSLMVELLPKIRARRIVSYMHRIPGRRCRQVIVEQWQSVFVLEDRRW